jgi:hypothetical protein
VIRRAALLLALSLAGCGPVERDGPRICVGEQCAYATGVTVARTELSDRTDLVIGLGLAGTIDASDSGSTHTVHLVLGPGATPATLAVAGRTTLDGSTRPPGETFSPRAGNDPRVLAASTVACGFVCSPSGTEDLSGSVEVIALDATRVSLRIDLFSTASGTPYHYVGTFEGH